MTYVESLLGGPISDSLGSYRHRMWGDRTRAFIEWTFYRLDEWEHVSRSR